MWSNMHNEFTTNDIEGKVSVYQFDKAAGRRGTACTKWDRYKSRYNLDDVIPLWVADMDFNCGEFITEALRRRTEHPIFGYTDPPPGIFETIADWNLRRYSCKVDPELICMSTGVVYSIAAAVQFFTKKSDKILVQTPVYPPFFNTPASLGRTVAENPLVRDCSGDWRFDYDGLKLLLRDDPAIRMLVLCNPHNPVGRCWTRQELSRLLTICAEYDVMVLSDEIHADLVLPGRRHCSVLSLDQALLKNTVVCASPTKPFNLAGLKVSYVVVSDQEHKKRWDAILKLTGISSINIYGFAALEAAYTHGDRWLEQCIAYIDNNLDYVDDFVRAHLPKVSYQKPEATYLAWLDFSLSGVGTGFNRDLKFKAGVELNDGADFGTGGAGFQRLNAACPRETLCEGLERIRRHLAAENIKK